MLPPMPGIVRRSGVEISQLAQGFVIGLPYDDVIEDFDFEKLPGADEVAGHFDVVGSPLGWLCISTMALADVMRAKRNTSRG